MVFEYTEEIPKQIPKALEEVLGLKVEALHRLKGGEVNYSFRVDTNEGPVIARVFRYESWPREDTLRLVEENLGRLGIRYPRTIYFDRSDRYFQNGFMVGEWIKGMPGYDAIKLGLVTEERMIEEVAKILRRVHTVKFEKFGRPPFNRHSKGEKDFSSYVLKFGGENRFERLVKEGLVLGELIELGKSRLQNLLNKIDFVIEPVMVHGDAGPANIIWTSEGPVLVDWEDMEATSCVYEVAWLSFWEGDKIRKPFFKGYGTDNIRMAECGLLESVFHLMLTLKLLPYYAYDLQKKERLESGIDKLQKLLDKQD